MRLPSAVISDTLVVRLVMGRSKCSVHVGVPPEWADRKSTIGESTVPPLGPHVNLVCCILGLRNRIAHERVELIVSVAQRAAEDQSLWRSLKKCSVVATSLMPRLVAPTAHVGA
jgi:hypothetical protein